MRASDFAFAVAALMVGAACVEDVKHPSVVEKAPDPPPLPRAKPKPVPRPDPPLPPPAVPRAELAKIADHTARLDVGEADGNALYDHLTPIGFSKDGKFAYFTEHADEAVGCYLWSFRVVDLVTDKPVYKKLWSESRCEHETSAKVVLKKYAKTFNDAMKTHGIDGAPKAIAHRELSFAGRKYAIKRGASTVTGEEPFLKRSSRIVVTRDDGKEKSVGKVTWVGPDALEAPYFVVSPHEPRAVLILPAWRMGWEGPPHVLVFELLGVHLEERF